MKRTALSLFLILLAVSVKAQNADIRILRSINSPGDLPSDPFFRFVSDSDPYLVFALPAAMLATGQFSKKPGLTRGGLTDLAALAAAGGISVVLKYAVDRDRPFVTYPDIVKKGKAGTPSFPSGHTSTAFATATSLSLSYPKWYIIAPSFAWAGTVGYSRMHLGVHYPSDVLAGALIGSGCAFLSWKISQKLFPATKH